MILIADSGATKTHWVLLDGDKILREIYTPGFNPYYYPTKEFEESLKIKLAAEVPEKEISHVYFYGSGISSEINRKIVRKAIHAVFPEVIVETYHDLHGAAVALFSDKKGIACILGTGSNSCLWDGKGVVQNVPSLGYFLGDEGSGTYIGKMFVRDVLIGDADKEITKIFYERNNLSFSKTLDKVYKEPNPNLFFAVQTRLLREMNHIPYCNQIVAQAFEDYVKMQLSRYPGYDVLPVSFVGSIAANFSNILEEVLSKHNIRLGKIMKEPMTGMIEHHLR